jgi:hypothetical protein
MKKILAGLAICLCAATSAFITAGVDSCHFEIDSRIIGLDLLKGPCHVGGGLAVTDL